LSWVEKDKKKYLAAVMLLILGVSSMTYEFQVSMQGFLNAQYAQAVPDESAAIQTQIETLKQTIETNKSVEDTEKTLLSKRQKEFEPMTRETPGYYSTQAKINSLLSDLSSLSDQDKFAQAQILSLQKSDKPSVKKATIASLFGLDENFFKRIVIIIQSILIIIMTPFCAGVALLFSGRSSQVGVLKV
jgi:hypothetical protein